jgi:TP901 family phage tail tape measure protein
VTTGAKFPLQVVIVGVDRITGTLTQTGARLEKFGKKFQDIGGKLTKAFTLPAAAIGAFALKVGLDFDRGMTEAGAAMRANEDEAERMRAAVRKIPSALGGISAGIAVLTGYANEGSNAADALFMLADGVNLARAIGLDGAEAAGAHSDTLAAFGLEARDSTRVANLLTAATGGSAKRFREWTGALQESGPALAAYGVTIEDALGTIAELERRGIEGPKAATALAAALKGLAAPSTEAKKALSGLGIRKADLFDAEGRLHSLARVFELLDERGATAEQRLAVFGKKVGLSLRALQGGGGAIAGSTAGLVGSDRTAASGAEDRSKGPAAAVNTLLASLGKIGVAIASSGLLEWLGAGADKLAGWIDKLAETNPGLLKFLTIAAGLVAVVGPIIGAIGFVASGFGAAATAVGILMPILASFAAFLGAILIPGIVAFGTALFATPIGWITLAVGALILAGVALYKNWDKVVGFFVRSWQNLKRGVAVVIDWYLDKLSFLTKFLPDRVQKALGIGAGGLTAKIDAGRIEAARAAADPGTLKTEGRIEVDFNNAPPGTRVRAQAAEELPLDVSLGLSMGG